MKVRPKKAPATAKMQNGQPTPKPMAVPYRFPAPIRGLVLNENRAIAQPGGARILDNWVPTTTGVRVRGGCIRHATVHATKAVETLFRYKSGGFEQFFAATDTTIVDITAPTSPLIPPTPVVTGRTSGRYSTEHFGTAGGDYLYAVNGTDSPLLYDGTTFTPITGASTPAITGVTTSSLSHVWSFANRLFFVEKDSMTAWYLPVDSIGGAAAAFSLAGVFKMGGALLFGARWSMDAGDGLDDKCVFVSTEGEVAVFEGTNPGSAADWRKAGIYQVSKPLGPKAITTAGGDLLIATELGLVPLSQAVQKDIAALEMGAVSQAIAPYWRQQSRALIGKGWEIIKMPASGFMLVSQPYQSDFIGTCLVANLQTGAWSRFTGWRTNCLGLFAGDGYFGDDRGGVFLVDSGGSDDGVPYTCVMLMQHEDFGSPIAQKTVLQMRPVFQVGNEVLPKIEALADYDETVSAPPPSITEFQLYGWDVGLWDEALWDTADTRVHSPQWVPVGVTGFVIAPLLQMTFGVTPTPRVELISVDATYTSGAIVA